MDNTVVHFEIPADNIEKLKQRFTRNCLIGKLFIHLLKVWIIG